MSIDVESWPFQARVGWCCHNGALRNWEWKKGENSKQNKVAFIMWIHCPHAWPRPPQLAGSSSISRQELQPVGRRARASPTHSAPRATPPRYSTASLLIRADFWGFLGALLEIVKSTKLTFLILIFRDSSAGVAGLWQSAGSVFHWALCAQWSLKMKWPGSTNQFLYFCIFVPQLPAHVPQERLSCLRLPLPCLGSAEHSHTRFQVAKCTAEMQTTLKNTALISEIPCCSQEWNCI